MEAQVERLVAKTWEQFQSASPSNRLLIAIAGIPGSGKTTLASNVAKGVNDRHHAQFHEKYPNSAEKSPSDPDIATALPLDGYHLTRKQLSEMPNPEEAVYRRGAAFTFDGHKYLDLVKELRKPIEATTQTIHAPSFDHAVKDPVDGDIPIPPTTRVVVFEGNYTALDREPWREAAGLMDQLWFIDVSVEVATARLIKRHLAAGLSPHPAHAQKRIAESDMRNGSDIIDHRLKVQEIVKSVEDNEWKATDVKQVEEEEEHRRPPTERMGSLAELAEAGGGM